MCRNCMGTCVVVEACCDPVCRKEGSQAKQVIVHYLHLHHLQCVWPKANIQS